MAVCWHEGTPSEIVNNADVRRVYLGEHFKHVGLGHEAGPVPAASRSTWRSRRSCSSRSACCSCPRWSSARKSSRCWTTTLFWNCSEDAGRARGIWPGPQLMRRCAMAIARLSFDASSRLRTHCAQSRPTEADDHRVRWTDDGAELGGRRHAPSWPPTTANGAATPRRTHQQPRR